MRITSYYSVYHTKNAMVSRDLQTGHWTDSGVYDSAICDSQTVGVVMFGHEGYEFEFSRRRSISPTWQSFVGSGCLLEKKVHSRSTDKGCKKIKDLFSTTMPDSCLIAQ